MLTAPDYSYLGSGEVHLRKKGKPAPFRSIGNCSAFSYSPQTSSIDLADSTTPGGSIRNSVQRITAVQYSFTMTDFSVDNFADVLRGSIETIQAGTVAAEQVVAYRDGITPLTYIATSITSVKSADGATTYQAGVDYDYKSGALYIYVDGAIPEPVNGAANVVVAYSYGAAKRLQALVNPAEDYELLFLGFNEARSGAKVRSHAFKLTGGALNELAMIADQHGSGTVSGNLSRDTTRPAGLSQYFTWETEEASSDSTSTTSVTSSTSTATTEEASDTSSPTT